MTPSPQDYRDALNALECGEALGGLGDLIHSLECFTYDSGLAGNREPEQAALARQMVADLKEIRRRYVREDVPKLAERIAQREAQSRADDVFAGPCRDWPAQAFAMNSDNLEAALASRTMEERP